MTKFSKYKKNSDLNLLRAVIAGVLLLFSNFAEAAELYLSCDTLLRVRTKKLSGEMVQDDYYHNVRTFEINGSRFTNSNYNQKTGKFVGSSGGSISESVTRFTLKFDGDRNSQNLTSFSYIDRIKGEFRSNYVFENGDLKSITSMEESGPCEIQKAPQRKF